MTRVLLIEDDYLLGEGLKDVLSKEGIECTWLTDIQQVHTHWIQSDLVILDRQLPEGDSLIWLPEWLMIKALPVIILTAKVDVEQRIEGLMSGAKDYMIKPFSHQELIARIHAHLRPLGQSTLHYHHLEICLSQRTVRNSTNIINLKPKEFQLLLLLLQHQGRVFHRDELLNQVWGFHRDELLNQVWGFQAFPSTRTVDNHILHLRQKLPELNIETLRGVGYRLLKAHHE